MKSYLLSTLAQRYAAASAEALRADFPHDWLLWEPGAWRAPRPSTLHVTAWPHPPEKEGEALALVLRAPGPEGQLLLGRGPEGDIVLNDATLSQRHLLFMCTPEGAWTVRDAGSTNGTWVDGQRLAPGRPVVLQPGSHIQAAEVHLSFHTPQSLLGRLRAPRAGEGR